MNQQQIFQAIKNDIQNQNYTDLGIDPLYVVSKEARILIIGQAPGIKAQKSGKVWNDLSGIKLREWMGLSETQFYNSNKIAIMPMDFYYPGQSRNGDLPPRHDFAKKWHPLLLEKMPNIELTLLVGSYAQKEYLNLKNSQKLTDVVRNYKKYLPYYFPIVHPSPLNRRWLKKNLWFEEVVVPELKKKVRKVFEY